MKRYLLPSAATLAALAVGFAAAQEAGGFYLKGFGGVSQLLGDEVDFSGSLSGSSQTSYDAGFIAGGAIGYAYTPNLAAEVEYAYRTGDADGFRGGVARSGDLASTAVLINGVYSFDRLANGLTPFVGIGIGALTEADFDLEGGTAEGEYSERGRFAFQGFGGIAYDVTDNWRLSGEVRYFDAGTPRMEGRRGAKLEVRYNTLDAVVGLTYRF